MKDCANNQKQHKKCKNEEKLNICLKCKRYYVNLPDDLKDLYRKKG